ncbi:putative E3 ubiquitin-protein ligase ubr7 [Trichinella sp. T6]|nr:putative E3 ubiquitin-protein ligase ubr7 [Trichinella sp. T6]
MTDNCNEDFNINDLIQFYDDVEQLAGAHGISNCTYPLGYVKRQAIYSCITCWEKSGSFCAICTACYLKCHNTHNALQLYTKRYSNSCLLSGRTLEAYSYDVFMRNGWRKELCHCLRCLDLYKTYDCEFLLDDEDTIEKYNENSQKNTMSSVEEMFDHYTVGMNPLQKLEIAYGIAEMKRELSQMVAECDGQTVTMEDVQRLNQRLEQIIAKKRARFEDKQY